MMMKETTRRIVFQRPSSEFPIKIDYEVIVTEKVSNTSGKCG